MPTMEKKETKYLTPKQVAEILEVPYSNVLDWINAGTLPAYRYGGRWKVERSELKEWQQQQKNTNRPQQ